MEEEGRRMRKKEEEERIRGEEGIHKKVEEGGRRNKHD